MAHPAHGLPDWIKWAAALFALLGTPLAAYVYVDQTYAKEARVEQRFQSVDQNLLMWQYQQLRREQLEWYNVAKRRPLDRVEQQRLQEIEDAIRTIQRKLKLSP